MMTRLLALFLVAAVPAAMPSPKVLLIAPPGESYVDQGLTALGIEHERIVPTELPRHSPFAADVVVADRDVARTGMTTSADLWREFVRYGGVFVGFRTSDPEPWLPVPLIHDRGYETARLLVPEHPAFTTPNTLDLKALQATHGGSIYHALAELGPGWKPLVEAGAPLGWDKREARSGGPHYGMAELAYGKGRILLVELIPAYNWFRDEKGNADSPGAKLFANLMAYALANASELAAKRPPAQPIAGAVASLRELLPAPDRAVGIAMDENWTITQQGPYTTKTDFRGVRTFLHADRPSETGNFIQASTTLTLPAKAEGPLLLQWYESDTYCGGNERILGGAKHGQVALDNRKAGYRFKQVLVNGQVAWEEDVLGRNVQPAWQRFHTLDIAPLLAPGATSADISLRVEDRQSSADLPFFIEVFFGRIALLAQPRPADALLAENGVPAAGQLLGPELSPVADGALQATAATTATWLVGVPEGTYRLALQVVDSPDGTGRIRLHGKGGNLGEWKLTANDGRAWWLLSDPVQLGVERLSVDFAAVDTPIAIQRLAAIPCPSLPSETVSQNQLPAPSSATVPLLLTENAGVERWREITAQTVPFARGVLRDPEEVALTTAEGEPVAVQTRPVATWPDGSIKILQTCFPATVPAQGTASFVLRAPNQNKGTLPVELTVQEKGDRIVVHTGPIRAELSTTHGRMVDAIFRGKLLLTSTKGDWDLVLEAEDGSQLHAATAPVTSTRIVESGPCRALILRQGWFVRADGTPTRLEYRIQTEFTAGSDELRVQTFLVNRDDAAEAYLQRWSLEVPWQQAQSGSLWLGDHERQARAGAVLYQHRENQVTWTGNESVARGEGACPGLVRLPGLVFGSRWFWQRFPQAIHFAEDRVVQDFIPRPLDNGDVPTEWAERMAKTTDKYPVGGIGYPQSPGKLGLFRLARGEALRQELLFRFTDASAPLPQLLARLDAPLRAHADARYMAGTRAYGQFHPRDQRLYPAYEDSVEAFLKGYLAKREKRREYGFENYGDDTFEWGYGPSFTYWSNSEYDHHHGFATEYLRSGDLRWWNEFEKTARTYADVVVIHHEVPGGYPQRGGPHHHNSTALWMPSDPRQGWVADHTHHAADSGHAWAEGMVDYWFLTGEPWAGEVVREMADWYVQIVAQNRYGAGGQERGPGWALVALSALARATNDPRVLAAGQSVADWIANWQDPVRGVVSVPISEQPSYEGGTVFMHGIVGRGLGRWYDVTGDPRTRQALLGVADWLVTEPMDAPGQFWYKQAPNCMHGYGATDQTLNALAYAYAFTGEERYGRVADALLGASGASVRGMSWFPQVLDLLADRRYPVTLATSADRAVAAPGTPAQWVLALHNTCEQPLQVVATLSVPTGFSGTAPAPFVLAPEGTEHLAIGLEAQQPTGTGEVALQLELRQPDGTTVTRHASVGVRAVPAIQRRQLAARDAAIHPPMKLVGTGQDAYIDDPRPADFSGNPLPADGDAGGWATWTFATPESCQLTLWAAAKWRDQKGNSLHLSVDGQPETVLGNTGEVGPWIWVKGPALVLSSGTHTIRIRTREEGIQLGSLWLTTLPDDSPPALTR